MALHDGIDQALREWVEALPGAKSPAQFNRLSGGANNLVYLCTRGPEVCVIKSYPQASNAAADRFKAEHEFLTYANKVAAGFVPSIVAVDDKRKFLAMEHLDGGRFETASDITPADVTRAADFLARLNADRALARTSISSPAVEGFLRITAHVENVAGRVKDLTAQHLPQQYQAAGQDLIARVEAAWSKVQADVADALQRGDMSDELPSAETCVSPSDFGFHNAIRTPQGVAFFDFEYAGWDDPTKAVADFFLQPRLTVPGQLHAVFTESTATCISAKRLADREAVLKPVLRLKWVTIVLAILRPQRFNALSQLKSPVEMPAFIEERLARARHLLA